MKPGAAQDLLAKVDVGRVHGQDQTAEADRLLMQRPEDLQAVLDKLVEAILECADSGLRVGPELDCDADDRDAKEWVAGGRPIASASTRRSTRPRPTRPSGA